MQKVQKNWTLKCGVLLELCFKTPQTRYSDRWSTQIPRRPIKPPTKGGKKEGGSHRSAHKHLLGEGVAAAGVPGDCSLGLNPLAVDYVLAMLQTGQGISESAIWPS